MKYAEYLLKKLSLEENYTHCYFVAGGNTMHLLDAARKEFKCIPVVNEVAAGIAAEYFNESNPNGKKAFALVTAGPGLTNIVTSLAGAYLESRELLVIGGQVKRSDLKSPELRQRGIQEIDGRAIAKPITIS
jgi:acetolactate synthase-1/2/3 large subunit